MNKSNLRQNVWYQVSGDLNPAKYGATIARESDGCIDVLRIDSTIECVGESEAVSVGVPFWTKEVSYDRADLEKALTDKGFLESMDVDPEDYNLNRRFDRLSLASEMESYGLHGGDSSSGWGADVCPRSVVWWCGRGGPGVGGYHDEDREYRQLVRDAKRRNR